MDLLQFVFEFMKTGLFAVGGGLATLPFLYSMSYNTGWFSTEDISNMVAVSESTPGPIGINMATYVGFTSFGMIGAILGPIALTVPSIFIIVLISKALDRFKEAQIVQDVFIGLRPTSTALVSAAGLQVGIIALFHSGDLKTTKTVLELINYKAVILAIVLFVALRKWKKHPIVYIAFAAFAGVIFKIGA